MLLAVGISLAALLALAGLFQFLGALLDARRFPPPGSLVDIGRGRRLHARATHADTGAPAIIFESGISATSINWIVTQPHFAELAPTCSYDRAGLGWSDPPRGPFTCDSIVADLAALLDRLDLAKRYVLVGHSYGGLLVRLFAERCPDRIAALVLIDPVLACVWQHPDPEHHRIQTRGLTVTRLGAHLARFGVIRFLTLPVLLRKSAYLSFLRSAKPTASLAGRLSTELKKLPPELLPLVRAHWCRPKNFRATAAHLALLPSSFDHLQNHFVPYPVTVISAADTPPQGIEEHRAIAALSTQGQHLIAQKGGHWVQYDEPALVIQAIKAALDKAAVDKSLRR